MIWLAPCKDDNNVVLRETNRKDCLFFISINIKQIWAESLSIAGIMPLIG